MERLPDDLFEKILTFLSFKERIILRSVSSSIKTNIRQKDLMTYRLSNLLPLIYSMESKRANQLILITNNDILYKPYDINYDDRSHVHPLFRVSSLKNKCVVERCREKSLGYIYIQIHTPHWWKIRYHDIRTNLLIKRKISYCLSCFNQWSNIS
jgi:hypothetical protein